MKYIILTLIVVQVLIPTYTETSAYTKETPREIELLIRVQAEVSAYTSEIDQTDDTPFITASNQRVRKGIVANNCLPFGSIVSIEGEKYEVQDRMNRRYGCNNYDIWMDDIDEAIEWGRRELAVIIY